MSDLVDCLTQHVIAFVTADLHRTQEPHVEVGVPVLVWKYTNVIQLHVSCLSVNVNMVH